MRLVAIGASWGGLHALQVLLSMLPGDFPAPVVIAQHRGTENDMLSRLLDRATALRVRDAEDKDALVAGEVLVAPPDYHLLVEEGSVALSVDEPVRFSRPSIDVLFDSAARAASERAIGVVLTGSNSDGAEGLATIRRRGGIALVQDPEEAERAEMPRAALAAAPGAIALPLVEIGPELVTLTAVSA